MQEIDEMSVLRDMIRTLVFSTNYFLSSDMYIFKTIPFDTPF